MTGWVPIANGGQQREKERRDKVEEVIPNVMTLSFIIRLRLLFIIHY